jgi:hypothetical protein
VLSKPHTGAFVGILLANLGIQAGTAFFGTGSALI